VRRGLATLIALFALTAPARADVLVPADPPRAQADCAGGAGDVVAVGLNGQLRMSVGGAPYQLVKDLERCPAIAAADDGTLALAGAGDGPSRMIVRRAGMFSAPIALADQAVDPDVAAARGGWVAAAWFTGDGDVFTLSLLVVAPDGRETRTTVASFRAAIVGWPRIAITPAGDVTAVWSELNADVRHVRVARVAQGAAPVVSALPGEVRVGAGAEYSLAVAPGGATLIAWAADDGVRALDGDGAPVLVSTGTTPSTLSAALNDAGAAIVAHGNSAREIVLVERPPGGTWTVPHVLDDVAREASDSLDDQASHVSGAVLAADGRAVVTWSDEHDHLSAVEGANGRVGGPWSGPASLSAATRSGILASSWLDAAGEPRVLWQESRLGLRGARLAAAREDVTAPVVTASLPARARAAEAGRFRLAVPVRCSEACDVRLTVRGEEVTRELPAGRTVTLRYRASAYLGELLLRRSRPLRVALVVTDRAGNVVRSSRQLQVRVVRRPLRSYKVGPGHDFGFDTAAGNRAAVRFVNSLIDRLAARSVRGTRAVATAFEDGLTALRRAGYEEVEDGEVRDALFRALRLPVVVAGYDAQLILIDF
jgi:hypothetical protein